MRSRVRENAGLNHSSAQGLRSHEGGYPKFRDARRDPGTWNSLALFF